MTCHDSDSDIIAGRAPRGARGPAWRAAAIACHDSAARLARRYLGVAHVRHLLPPEPLRPRRLPLDVRCCQQQRRRRGLWPRGCLAPQRLRCIQNIDSVSTKQYSGRTIQDALLRRLNVVQFRLDSSTGGGATAPHHRPAVLMWMANRFMHHDDKLRCIMQIALCLYWNVSSWSVPVGGIHLRTS